MTNIRQDINILTFYLVYNFMSANKKQIWNVLASNGEQQKEFKVYTSKGFVNRIAEKTAQNLFYNDNIRVLSIF